MSTQNFVGNKPVDEFPAEAKQQVDLKNLEQQEKQRLEKGATEAGYATRAAVASRDPAEFDPKSGGQGDTQPTQHPVM